MENLLFENTVRKEIWKDWQCSPTWHFNYNYYECECGEMLRASDRFCSQCGRQLDWEHILKSEW